MAHVCEGNLWVYYDTKSYERVSPDDISCPGKAKGFIATFNHTITGARSEIELTWLGTRVLNTLYYMDIYVYFKYEDLYPLLSQDERYDLETMSFLFRNTTYQNTNNPCMQGCGAALYSNLKGTEEAWFKRRSYAFLIPLVSQQITEVLLDSTRCPKTFLDKEFRKPLVLWKATNTEVHQIADKKFPGEFKDSVAIKAYGTQNVQLQFTADVLSMHFHTGETLYCRSKDFLEALPPWCARFVGILYHL